MTTRHIIDAAGKSLGRTASMAAKILMGKSSPEYTPNVNSDARVTVINVSKLSITEKKLLGKKFTRYSGYPGGLKAERLGVLAAKKGRGAALRRAIERMLPRNTFRVARLKRLTMKP